MHSTPSFIFIGDQSVGKSSLINALLNEKILPTGTQLITKQPIRLSLFNSSERYFIYENKKYSTLPKINFTCLLTEEIHLKYYQNIFPAMDLVDLPGLIAIKSDDQAIDTKEKIDNMIGKYITDENNIIVNIISAQQEINNNRSIELTRKYDKNFKRTLVIVNKCDLNENIDIFSYNDILKMEYGYHGISAIKILEEVNEQFGIENLRKKLIFIYSLLFKKVLIGRENQLLNKYRESKLQLKNLIIEKIDFTYITSYWHIIKNMFNEYTLDEQINFTGKNQRSLLKYLKFIPYKNTLLLEKINSDRIFIFYLKNEIISLKKILLKNFIEFITDLNFNIENISSNRFEKLDMKFKNFTQKKIAKQKKLFLNFFSTYLSVESAHVNFNNRNCCKKGLSD